MPGLIIGLFRIITLVLVRLPLPRLIVSMMLVRLLFFFTMVLVGFILPWLTISRTTMVLLCPRLLMLEVSLLKSIFMPFMATLRAMVTVTELTMLVMFLISVPRLWAMVALGLLRMVMWFVMVLLARLRNAVLSILGIILVRTLAVFVFFLVIPMIFVRLRRLGVTKYRD